MESRRTFQLLTYLAMFGLIGWGLSVGGFDNRLLADLMLAGAAALGIAGAIQSGLEFRKSRTILGLKIMPHYLILGGLLGGAICLLVATVGYCWATWFPESAPKADVSGTSPQRVPMTSAAPVKPVPGRQPYRLTDNNLPPNFQTVIRVTDGASIPPDPRNAERQSFSAWLFAGNRPDPVQATLPPIYAPRSPKDAEREIPIVDKLFALLGRAIDQVQEGRNLLSLWQQGLNDASSGAYFQKVIAFRERFSQTNAELQTATQEIPQFCDDDLCTIVDTKNGSSVNDAINKFLDQFDRLHGVVDSDKYIQSSHSRGIEDIVVPALEPPNYALIGYRVSAIWARNQLTTRRKQLSEIASR